jgi:hypothetical protein
VLNWSISRNHKKILNSTKINVTPGMYVTREDNVQRPLTSGPGGSRQAKSLCWPASFWVSLDQNFLDKCLHEKGKVMAVEKVGGGQTHWPVGRVARVASCHLVSYCLSQVFRAPPWPHKYHPTSESWHTHTHTPHFGDSSCKALIPSVVARHSLVGRVVRLWEWRASWPVGSPPRSSSVKALP